MINSVRIIIDLFGHCMCAQRVYRWLRRRLRSDSWRVSWGRLTSLALRTITWSLTPCEKRQNTSLNSRLLYTMYSKVSSGFCSCAVCFGGALKSYMFLCFQKMVMPAQTRSRLNSVKPLTVGKTAVCSHRQHLPLTPNVFSANIHHNRIKVVFFCKKHSVCSVKFSSE